jgi:orotidine-5'-phosphate decarboxylase
MSHFADRLNELIRKRGTPLCLGLDPRWESLPASLRVRYDDNAEGRAEAYREFCSRVLDLVGSRAGGVRGAARADR